MKINRSNTGDYSKCIPAKIGAAYCNKLFYSSVDGAKASSIIYSLVKIAKANNPSVFQYLYIVLLYMPGYKSGSEGIEQLLPWSNFIKAHCSDLIDVETITVEDHLELSV